MKRECWWKIYLFLALVLLLSACATKPLSQPPAFTPQPIPNGAYQQKADNLAFVLDASSSMLDGYRGVQKFALERNDVAQFNQTMPDLKLQTVLRSFGHDSAISQAPTLLLYGPAPYSRSGVAQALDKLSIAGGPSPMAAALRGVGSDLKGAQGNTALVVLSDGEDMDAAPLATAAALKEQFKGRLCIYPVFVGEKPAGKAFMDQLAAVTSCGAAVKVNDISNGPGMAAFVKQVLLGQATPQPAPQPAPQAVQPPAPQPAPPAAAPKTATVTKEGTWIFKDVQFEVNSAKLKPSSYPTLDDAVATLKANPALRVEIQGHTDITGSHAYNMKLSQRRAESVMDYLKGKGIAADRMTAKGYGPDKPIASNQTAEGRAQNRRVEFKPLQ